LNGLGGFALDLRGIPPHYHASLALPHRSDNAARNTGLDALRLQSLSEPVGVIAAVTQQPFRFGQVVQQSRSSGVVADLPGGHEEAERAAVGVGDGVKLGVHAALCAADQAPEIPFLTRRLEAVRCAFK